MNKLVVFDFNRTLFDPEASVLLPGALEALDYLRAGGYKLILLAQAAPGRRQTIATLGLEPYFSEVLLVERKSRKLFADLAARHMADQLRSFVVGDRARKEIYYGKLAGWQTVWLRRGRFAAELPRPGYAPDHTITQLHQITNIL